MGVSVEWVVCGVPRALVPRALVPRALVPRYIAGEGQSLPQAKAVKAQLAA